MLLLVIISCALTWMFILLSAMFLDSIKFYKIFMSCGITCLMLHIISLIILFIYYNN